MLGAARGAGAAAAAGAGAANQASADSDSDACSSDSGASSDSAGGAPPEQFSLQDGGLSSEEVARMRDELLALQTHNQELLEERAVLMPLAAAQQSQQIARQTSTPSILSAAEAASAFGQKFSSQMKSNTAAVHALGVKGMSSLQSGLKQGLVPSGAESSAALAVRSAAERCSRDELEALGKEMQSLRDRIRAAGEEADDFRAVAADARKAEAEAARAASEPDPHAELPSAAELRRAAAELCDDGDERAMLEDVDDRALLRVARAALQPGVRAPTGPQVPAGPGDAPTPADAPSALVHAGAADDEDYQLLGRKTESQQQELDQLRELLHKQQEQIAKYRDQLSGKEEPGAKEVRRQLKAKLADAERQVADLHKQLEANEEESRGSSLVRSQLRDLAETALHRDADLATMRSLLEYKRSEGQLVEDRLRMACEDVAGMQALRAQRPERARSALGGAAPAVPATEPAAVGAASSEAGVQADLLPDGLAALARRARLEAEISDLRVGAALLERRTARELRELRTLVGMQDPSAPGPPQPPPEPSARAAPLAAAGGGGAAGGDPSMDADPVALTSAVDTGDEVVQAPLRRSDGDDGRTGGGPSPRRGAVVYDIGSDNDDPLEMELEPDSDAEADAPPPPPNLVYIERVAELEQRSDGLRRELAAAHEDERALRAGIHDKNQLVAHLARKAELSGNRSAAAHAGDAPARGGGRSREESTAELERVLAEATEENVRLRNDIQVLAGEFRQALSRER